MIIAATPITPRALPPAAVSTSRVRAILAQLARTEPDRTDEPLPDDRPARYLRDGEPTSLVAHALIQLGYPQAILRELDREHALGDLRPGVHLAQSRHRALRALQPSARALLEHIQRWQGRPWSEVVTAALAPAHRLTVTFDRRRRPWLY